MRSLPLLPAPADPQGEGVEPRIVALDALRGLAILLVIIHHYVTVLLRPDTATFAGHLLQMLTIGWIGVDLFFVLSGFLIGCIILRYGHIRNFLPVFYARRAARLFPLYFVLVISYAVTAHSILSWDTPAARWLVIGDDAPLPLWSYFAYLQNIFAARDHGWGAHWLSVTWSLAVEEQFYLLALVLLLAVPRRVLPVVLGLLILFAPLVRVGLLLQTGAWIPSYVVLPARWDALLAGIFGAYLFTSPAWRGWLQASPSHITNALVSSGAALIAILVTGQFYPSSLTMMSVGFTLLAVFSLSLIGMVILVPGRLAHGLSSSTLLVQLGGISYGVYLIHQPMQGLVRLALGPWWPQIDLPTDLTRPCVAVVLTVGAAVLSRRYLENPILAFARRRWIYGSDPSNAVPSNANLAA